MNMNFRKTEIKRENDEIEESSPALLNMRLFVTAQFSTFDLNINNITLSTVHTS